MYIFVTRSIQIISLIIKSVSRDDKKLIWSSINKALLWTLGKSKEEMLIYIFWEKNVNICVYLDGIVTCIGHNKYRCLRKNSLLFSSLSLLHHRLFWVQIYTRNLRKHLPNRNKIWHILFLCEKVLVQANLFDEIEIYLSPLLVCYIVQMQFDFTN